MNNSNEIFRTNIEVFEFFKDKEMLPPVTKSYLKKGWGQTKDGYLSYAQGCQKKGDFSDVKKDEVRKNYATNYFRIKKCLENNDFPAKFRSISEMEPLIDIAKIDYGSGTPSQKWHLYSSYFAQLVVEDDRQRSYFRWNKNFNKASIRCSQLRLWMAEVSGINIDEIENEIKNNNKAKANEEIRKITWNAIFEKIPVQTEFV